MIKYNNLPFTRSLKNIIGIRNDLYYKLFKITKNSFASKKDNQEEPEVEIDVKIKEDIYNKRDVIESDPTEKYRYNFNFNDKHFEYCSLEELISTMKRMVKARSENYDQWYKAIMKFNDYLCNHQISKTEVIEFLEILNFFRPKILEKKNIPEEIKNMGSQIAFSKKHEEEYYRLIAPKDMITQFALFLKKNIKLNVINKLIKETTKYENRENIDENLEDLLGLYEILFRNIEMKVIDDIKNGRASYTHSECVNFISCFSRASEGTNLFYEVLMRKIAKHAEELSLEEIEIILNYLPHDLYNNPERKSEIDILETTEEFVDDQKIPEKGRTEEISKFYKTIFEKIIKELDKFDNKNYLNFWQGILKVKFIDVEIISSFLTNFDLRITKNEEKKKFFFDFLQIFAYFLKNEENEKYFKSFDLEAFYKSIETPFIKKYLRSFDLKEIATVFWICYHFKIINLDKIKTFEKQIEEILMAYINDPKSKIDSMGYETHLRYYDNYTIEPHDLNALYFFIQTEKKYNGELLEIIKKALKCIELEDTHPISRSWLKF